jgi:hypothetical protein
VLSPQLACVMHCPFWQDWFVPHVPHTPPQPSGPQTLPPHCFVQHALLKQTSPVPQAQSAPQFPQFSPIWQTPLPQVRESEHWKLVPHT